MATGAALTANEYISHHLVNLTAKIGEGPFWTLHLDTLIVSGLVGCVVFGLMYYVGRHATAGVPGKLQAFIEIVVGMVELPSMRLSIIRSRFSPGLRRLRRRRGRHAGKQPRRGRAGRR